jgi:aspartyl-tRNA(Asn)/glutamyl-tRNA(Gln) amidotransferase subunit C
MEIKEIDNLAKLCRIELSDDEKVELLKEMDTILDFVNQIQTVKVDDEKKEAGTLRNVLREDKEPHESGQFTESILSEAPGKEGGYFKVKKIL